MSERTTVTGTNVVGSGKNRVRVLLVTCPCGIAQLEPVSNAAGVVKVDCVCGRAVSGPVEELT
jgi:hypothetical protein